MIIDIREAAYLTFDKFQQIDSDYFIKGQKQFVGKLEVGYCTKLQTLPFKVDSIRPTPPTLKLHRIFALKYNIINIARIANAVQVTISL